MNKFVKYILPLIIVIGCIASVLFFPLKAENVTLQAYFANASDGDKVSAIFRNYDDSKYECTSYVYDNRASFKINPDFLNPANIYIRYNSRQKTVAHALSVHSGSFNADNDILLKLIQIKEPKIIERNTFTVTDINEVNISDFASAVAFNWPVKTILCVIILLLYGVYALCICASKDDKWCIILRRCMILLLIVVICFSFLFNAHLFRQNPRTDVKEVYEPTTSAAARPINFNNSVKQSFTSDRNMIKAIRVYIDNSNPQKVPTVGLKLTTPDSKVELCSTIVNPDFIITNGYAELEINGKADFSKGKTYIIEIRILEGSVSKVYVHKADKNFRGTLTVDSKKGNGILRMSAVYSQTGFTWYSIALAIAGSVILVLSAAFYKKIKQQRNISLFIVYGIAFTLAAVQTLFFLNNMAGTLRDEAASVSYVAHLAANKGFVPDFSSMKLLKAIDGETAFSTTSNYLIQPPLYYHILKLFGFVDIYQDTVTVNLAGMRIVTAVIGLLSIAVSFAIGYTRINKELPAVHLLYASAIISFTSVFYNFSGVNSFALLMLGLSVYFFGLLRFSGKRRTKLTFIIISLGYSIVCLTNYFAAMVITALTVILIFVEAVRARSFKTVFGLNTLFALPLIVLAITYYIVFAVKYKYFPANIFGYSEDYIAMQTLSFDTRRIMTMYEYVKFYFTSFFGSWTGISSGIMYTKESAWFAPDRIVPISMVLAPFILFAIRKSRKYVKLFLTIFITLFFAFAVYFMFGTKLFYETGLTWGTNCNFFIAFVPILAFMLCEMLVMLQGTARVTDLKRPEGYVCINPRRFVAITSIVLSSLLLYGGFISFLINY